jgi:hypothetical protein
MNSLDSYFPIEMEKYFSSRVIDAKWFVYGRSNGKTWDEAGRLQSWTSVGNHTSASSSSRSHLQLPPASRELENKTLAGLLLVCAKLNAYSTFLTRLVPQAPGSHNELQRPTTTETASLLHVHAVTLCHPSGLQPAVYT